MVRPIPCPARSRTTWKPRLFTSPSTARPMSRTRLPATATSIAFSKAPRAAATSRRRSSVTRPTGTVMAASAM
jgi:hypothetical protein